MLVMLGINSNEPDCSGEDANEASLLDMFEKL